MKISELLNEQHQDIDDVAAEQGFEKGSEKITVRGKRVRVTTLKKNETVGGLELELEYVINPKTGAWVLKAGLPGEVKVDFHTGEDTSSLVKHLKKKRKITAHQAVQNLG